MTAGSLPIIRDPFLAAEAGLLHGFAERHGGVSDGRFSSLNLGPRTGDDPARVRANRERFLNASGVSELPLLAPRQAHSADVAIFARGDVPPDHGVLPGDAIVTDVPGVALMVLAADCVPVLLFDARRRVIAAVHAGWRGTAGGIAARAVSAMRGRFGCSPADIRIAVGPAIGRCCYEVGGEVIRAVGHACKLAPEVLYEPLPSGKARLDLIAANTAQLHAAGVPDEQVSSSGLCTACRVDRFFSHRREGEPTGRGGAMIALCP